MVLQKLLVHQENTKALTIVFGGSQLFLFLQDEQLNILSVNKYLLYVLVHCTKVLCKLEIDRPFIESYWCL
jgi:hypothetical protein